MDNDNFEAGFSLIELSFSMAIFAIALIAISSFFINNLKATTKPLKYQALNLCKSTLEEYKSKEITNLKSKFEDYGTIKAYNYDPQKFKRKVEISGKQLKKIKVTVFWKNQSKQEQKITLTTMRSAVPFSTKKNNKQYQQNIKKLLIAKAELNNYKQQHNKFPAWDQRTGTLNKLSNHYSNFTTIISNKKDFSYRNPKFYNWWKEGYLLIYQQPIDDKYYCITNNSGIFTIKAKNRSPKQLLGDMFANNKRDQLIFKNHALKFSQRSVN